MTETSQKTSAQKLPLRKRTLELFLSGVANSVINAKERLKQKKDKIISKSSVLQKVEQKCHDFNSSMEKKYGQVYVKLRDSAKNITRTVLAAQMFGLPGVVGMCAYKTCEKAMSLLEPAAKAKNDGKTDSILGYLSQNKDEANFTMTSGALSIASAACDVAGAPLVKGVVRLGKASLLISPEVSQFLETTKKWFNGDESFSEVRRDAAVMGITFGTYFISDVPMTRGSGKPENTDSNKTFRISHELSPKEKLKVLLTTCFCPEEDLIQTNKPKAKQNPFFGMPLFQLRKRHGR